MYKNRIKVGVDEKKKTQGMRRDSAHHCGVFFCYFGWCVFLGGRKLDEKENWEVGDTYQNHHKFAALVILLGCYLH